MTKATITFAICLGVYLVGLLIFVLVKRHLAKKNYKKRINEDKDNESKE